MFENKLNELSFTLAFGAGFMSFVSPCVFPLVPAYISFITGLSLEELKEKKEFIRPILSALCFALGFSTIFVALGASSSLLGSFFTQYQDIIRVVGGIMMMVFGLFIAGIFKPELLMREKRLNLTEGYKGFIGAFFIGISFAAGWTPCIGPILGSILVYAGSQGSASFGFQLLAVYSLGLTIPFLISTIAINLLLRHLALVHKIMQHLMIFSGILLIFFGFLLLTDNMKLISKFLPDLGVKLY